MKKTTPVTTCKQCGRKCRTSSIVCKKCAKSDYQYARNAQLKHHYGITIEQYYELKQEQGNRCGMCSKAEIRMNKALEVDHNHETDKVRGLLCNNCNQALGLLKADYGTELLEAAIAYIKRTNQ